MSKTVKEYVFVTSVACAVYIGTCGVLSVVFPIG